MPSLTEQWLAVGAPWKDRGVTGIRLEAAPLHIDGPSLVAAASGLMLLPENASRLVRLHRLAALGMALTDSGAKAASPSAVRGILKHEDIGGPAILAQEDPYSEVLVQSVDFFGGPYLVSGGSGEHAVADIENLLDAAFREQWMPDDMRGPARQLVQGLLTISDIVLKQAGLTRGTLPGRLPRTPIDVPGAAGLTRLADATYISNSELDSRGSWLRMVVDTFAVDPGLLVDPCAADLTDDRLYVTPFLRLSNGYRVVLPLDLLVTIRFHLLRFAYQAGQLEALGNRFRDAAFRRFVRLLDDPDPDLLEQSDSMNRYLLQIDGKRAVHVIVATDPLRDWEPEVWGAYDTHAALARVAELVEPGARSAYSSTEDLLHLVIIDSPGRGAFWGVPNVSGADPIMIARSDDLEVILHEEPDGLLGLLLFAQGVDRRPGRSMSTDILDEYSAYLDHDKSFYLSDSRHPDFTVFQTGDGFYPRQKYYTETDRHGVIPPGRHSSIVPARRRYDQDMPAIFFVEPSSQYIGYVVELQDGSVFITLDRRVEFAGVAPNLLECVAYWVHECATRIGARATGLPTELVLRVSEPEAWRRVRDWSMTGPAVRFSSSASGYSLEFTDTFVALLHEGTNAAERELVTVLLSSLFGIATADLASAVDVVAPLGWKRMLNAFDESGSPDMRADRLPRPLTGHGQVMAQVLDELGEWLTSPTGGGYSTGAFDGDDRVRALNAAVKHLFDQLEGEISRYDQRGLLDFLIAQNESLLHDAKFEASMLKSRLSCFGEGSHTVDELVRHRKENATAQRTNRFLIEYVAARPPAGTRVVDALDYLRLLSLAVEIVERATISDFLHYGLADFEVSILESGRLGVSREEPVSAAMTRYAENSGMRSVRKALASATVDEQAGFDVVDFVARSESAMRAEFGFSLTELREVCGGLLDLATADQVTHIDRSQATSEIAAKRAMAEETVSVVVSELTLVERSSFLGIGPDAWPWRYNRNVSYVRRPLVAQADELVFGFRSIYRLGPYWVDNILSGRLQGRAKSSEMRRCISEARREVNDLFARSVAARLAHLDMTTRVSVKKIGGRRIADESGNDIGDIDVLAVHRSTRSILAVEAKDFEVARTPAEIANEFEKLLRGAPGKKSAIELHGRRIEWLREHLGELVVELGLGDEAGPWTVAGVVVTSEHLITPLVDSSPFPVVALDDLGLDALGLGTTSDGPTRARRRGGR